MTKDFSCPRIDSFDLTSSPPLVAISSSALPFAESGVAMALTPHAKGVCKCRMLVIPFKICIVKSSHCSLRILLSVAIRASRLYNSDTTVFEHYRNSCSSWKHQPHRRSCTNPHPSGTSPCRHLLRTISCAFAALNAHCV
jgi:hypothetical protein